MPRVPLSRMIAELKRYGVTVETVTGAASRGSAAFRPRGVVCHWTAGPRRATGRPSLRVVTHGRPGLPGPLAQVYLDRQGVAVIVATGRANHAGRGGWKGLTGNSSVFGIEAECGGDGDWTDAQRAAYPRVVAALCRVAGVGADRVCGHNEWAPGRKVDIRDWPMSGMRSTVAALLAGKKVPAAPTPSAPAPSQWQPAPPGDQPTLRRWHRGEPVKWVQRTVGASQDGYYGADTEKAVKAFQRKHGLPDDGVTGPDTWSAVRRTLGKSGERATDAPSAPPFPLKRGQYFGPRSGGRDSISGYYSHRQDLRRWQNRMRDRGWSGIVAADGYYGARTAKVARQFQKEKRLTVDGLIGPATWRAAWEAPRT